jgi:hypothetical protein
MQRVNQQTVIPVHSYHQLAFAAVGKLLSIPGRNGKPTLGIEVDIGDASKQMILLIKLFGYLATH